MFEVMWLKDDVFYTLKGQFDIYGEKGAFFTFLQRVR